MLDTLLRLVLEAPAVTCWAALVTLGAIVGGIAAFEPDERMRQLLLDVRRALDRAGHSLDYASRCVRMPGPKLSDQLRGASPFTAMRRLFASDELAEFEPEFLALRAQRYGLTVVRSDVGTLLAKLDAMLDGPKPMAKAELPTTKEQVSA